MKQPALTNHRKLTPNPVRLGCLALACFILAPSASYAQLTREQAVAALLAPPGGVLFDPPLSTIWSPRADFGSGPGFEGLIPAGSTVAPRFDQAAPLLASILPVDQPSYLFWFDDAPVERFVHPTRFVLVNAAHPNPTVANGGITRSEQGWWPVVTLPGGASHEFFSTDIERSTDAPAGFDNPQGHIAGPANAPVQEPLPLLSEVPDGTGAAGAGQPTSRACGLIFAGHDNLDFLADAHRHYRDLRDHYNLSTNRIILVNGGMASTADDLRRAVTNLCHLSPPCDKVFVRIGSHGFEQFLLAKDSLVIARELREILAPIAAKGVPVCMLVDACYSASLDDFHHWNFPAGSSLLFSANAERRSKAGHFLEAGFGGAYSISFSRCLNSAPAAADQDGDGQIGDCEAHEWLLRENPCFTPSNLTNIMLYPASDASVVGLSPEQSAIVTNRLTDPRPQKRTVGRHPFTTVLQVCNGTGRPQTGFHIIYQGNVTNVVLTDGRRVLGNGVPYRRWATNGVQISYDPVKDVTQVSWIALDDPVFEGDYIRVTATHPQRGLRPRAQFWTDELPVPGEPPEPGLSVPGGDLWIEWETRLPMDSPSLRAANPEVFDAGGYEWITTIKHDYVPVPVGADALNQTHPALSNQPPAASETFELPPGTERFIGLRSPPANPRDPLPALIVQSEWSWPRNQNTNLMFYQFYLPLPIIDTTCITSCPNAGVFLTVNPPGAGSTFHWYKDGEPIPGENNGTLLLTNLRGIDAGTYTGIATNNSLVKRKFFKLIIEDFTPPTLQCPSNIVAQCFGPTGASVNFQVTASDNCGGVITLECEPAPGSLFPLGVSFVSCIARDSFQNSSVCTFTVTVIDPSPPSINCPNDIAFTVPVPVQVTYSSGAFDLCNGPLAAFCEPPSGHLFPIGTTPVVCLAADSSGNTISCVFHVTLQRPGQSTLRLNNDGLTYSLSWNDPDGQLQSAPATIGPWAAVANPSNPFVLAIDPAQPERYFRLFYPNSLGSLQGAFASDDGNASFSAYQQLHDLGVDAIQPLLALASVTAPFSSSAYQNQRSSRVPMDPPSVGLISLYLVDGILLGHPQPHYSPSLISSNLMTPQQKFAQAANLYSTWWNLNRGKTLSQLRAHPHPLANSSLRWNGPLLEIADGPDEGQFRPGSRTPWDRRRSDVCISMPDGADAGTDPDDYAWIYRPLRPSGPAPYNCLAWAMNCYNDRWLDLPLANTRVWETLLRDHHYQLTSVPCDAPCPPGSGPKLKMIWHVKPGETPSDENWVHAMKEEPDGDWSSKNGMEELSDDIKDCRKFLDKYYPVPVDQVEVIRCYCK